MDNGAPKRKRGRPKGSKNKNSPIDDNSYKNSPSSNFNDINLDQSPVSINQNLETKTPESLIEN
jgi:hypothetical protein